MNEFTLLGIAFAAAIFGAILGYLFSNFKSKGVKNTLEERNHQLNLQFEDFRENTKQLMFELKQDAEKQYKAACEERETIRKEKDSLRTELTRKASENENLQEKLTEQKAELEKLQEKFSKEFENLANKILEQKSEKFTSLNKENIQNILDPLQQKIKSFEEKVEKNSNDFIERNAELGKQLQMLSEQNIKISEEATNLTRALKGDTQKQGNWGEMILESVLEKSGLRKDHEYFTQQSFTSEEGKRVRPDVIIHLPGEKRLIVDSKVSLNAYERYCNAEEEAEKDQLLKLHLRAVKDRVEELSNKNYHSLYQMDSPDFVLLFIPIEAAFASASQKHPALYSDAFEKNIIIVTPTTLLAVLKTIDSMWQNEKQKQNAIDIATQAGALYDAFTNLTEELLKVGRQLGTVQNSYEGAMKKLTGKGNLLRRVEKLKKLGAKASKQLDQKLLSRAESDEEILEDQISE
ncbi:DNA recombination protein RmuC [Salinimicrobium soli]|uniref:DNA recombination protein RmuC n=1 Tax=Salinimicrobium soli TaxID=1254399 RepID=UPI003AAEC89A